MKKYVAIVTMIMVMAFYFAIPVLSEANKADLTKVSLEDIYTLKSFKGKNAKDISFSENDRYLAFLWNKYEDFYCAELLGTRPYQETGFDLFVYDTQKGTLTRVTSLERMKQFDPPKDTEEFEKKRKQAIREDNRLQEQFLAQRDYLLGKISREDLEKFEMEEIETLKLELKKEKEEAEAKKKEAEKKAQEKKNEETKNQDLKEEVKKEDLKKEDLKKEDVKKEDVKKEEEKKDATKDAVKDDKKADAKGEAKKDKELELWELRAKLAKKKEKDKIKLRDLYPGVSTYKWSKKATELIFQYRGDLFRYFPAANTITRLTMTDAREQLIDYTPDGKGYFYSMHNAVYMVQFDSSYIHQINHQLNKEDKYSLFHTDISPDGKWMILVAAKSNGPQQGRQVQIMDYNKRFAESYKVYREVPDDKRDIPSYRFHIKRITKTNYGKEPEHVFESEGGDVWFEFSELVWAEDSSKYAFITWEREKGDLKIWLGETAEGKKPELFFQMKEDIGFKSTYLDNLRFTPDSKKLAAVLNNADGFRQPVIFDIKTKTKTEVVKGKFESFPILGFSKNGAQMYVVSDKDSTAAHSIYKVDIASGKMTDIGLSGGMHRDAVMSHNNRTVVFNYGNMDNMPELYIKAVDSPKAKVLTDSHDKEWKKYFAVKPDYFEYKNRHGDLIRGQVFKPFGWKADDQRPAVIYYYGGPLGDRHTVEIDGFSSLATWFQMIMAARHGYVTVSIDPRGQSGYGKRFSEANFKDVGNPQTEDLEDLAKHLKTGFGIDTAKMGIHGWSFGGYQTIKTMLDSPETFACGIATASVTEWENYNSWYTGSTVGESKRGKLNISKYSLLPEAHKLKHPLLLVHGMKDDNVLFQDTLKMYDAFLRAGKETLVELFLDPEGDHGLNGSVKNKSVFKKYEAWFTRHLGKAK